MFAFDSKLEDMFAFIYDLYECKNGNKCKDIYDFFMIVVKLMFVGEKIWYTHSKSVYGMPKLCTFIVHVTYGCDFCYVFY